VGSLAHRHGIEVPANAALLGLLSRDDAPLADESWFARQLEGLPRLPVSAAGQPGRLTPGQLFDARAQLTRAFFGDGDGAAGMAGAPARAD
jgi:hypothetical protein